MDIYLSVEHTLLFNTELTQVQTWKVANKVALKLQKIEHLTISKIN